MKKSLVLLMSLVFLVAACNNNKTGKNQNTNNRDKDDYGRNDNRSNENENNTNENTGNRGWSQRDKSTFLRECVASFDENQTALANQICPCVLGKMEKEFDSYSDANSKAGEEASTRMALQCKDEVIGNSDNNGNDRTVNNWSRSDENQWMNACSPPLVQSMGEQRANSYCSCVLDKLKQMFSSFEEVNTKGTNDIGVELGKQCAKELGIGQ